MDRIQWLEWSPAAFEKARKEDKLILMDIGAVWCHWCHVMDEESYANPDIIKIVNRDYVPIRVDNDKRPDINDRYNQGGWPTTVILTADGFIVHGATYLPPATVKELLKRAKEWYAENKSRISEAAKEIGKEITQVKAQRAEPGELKDFTEPIIEDIKKNADPVHGGFGDGAKFPHPAGMSLIFAYYHSTGSKEVLEFAEKTLHNMGEGLLDKEEGGLFRYSVTPDWSVPHYERNLNVNAECLQNYLDAYRVTGKKEYAEAAEKIIDYALNTLSNREHGGFYGSQDADIYDEEKMKIVMDGEDYFKLPRKERKKHGIPYIDKTIYTNWNALMISSFLDAYYVLGRNDCRDFGLKTLKLLMEHCLDEKLGAYHYLRDGKPGELGMLTDSIALVRAALDAYETTGNREYLGHAERLMSGVVDRLNAPDGGFYDAIFDESLPPATRIRHKPMNDNAQAAEVLARLYNYTTKFQYQRLAEATLAAFSGNVSALLDRGMGYFASEIAVASRYVSDNSTKVAILGSASDSRCVELLTEAKRIYRPAKMVQILDPSEDMTLIEAMKYPVDDLPVAHVCSERGCSVPVRAVEELRKLLVS